MGAQLTIAGISLDCAEPEELADFYVRLLDARVLWRSESSVGVRAGGYTLVLQRVAEYRPPRWPGASIVHLDLAADAADLPRHQRFAVDCGATVARNQPDPRWVVLLDPAGHPFCITPFTPPD